MAIPFLTGVYPHHENGAMLAEHPIAEDWSERLARLVDTWTRDAEVAAVYLFGSRAGPGWSSRSDVDLAVILCGSLGPEQRWRKRLALLDAACRGLRTDAVHLVVLEDVPSLLGHRVLRDGRLLLDRDPRRRVAVVETLLRRYFDEAPIRAELDRALSRRVAEGTYAR